MMKRCDYSRMPKILPIFWRRFMDSGTQELEKGIQRNQPPIEHTPNPKKIKKGLEKLGKTKKPTGKNAMACRGSATTARVKAVVS